MTFRHYLGENTKAILNTLDANGPMSRDQVVAATGIERDTVGTYLRRCAFRGLVTADRTVTPPVFAVTPGWEAYLVTTRPPDRPKKPRPEPVTTVAIARQTQPNSVFALGAQR
jgi:hypothetical protein